MVEHRDRRGTLVAEAHFGAGGALSRAWVRIPDGSWVGIEPRATREAPWGLSDRAWHAPRGAGPRATRPPADFEGCVPLTVFEAIDWTHVERIVPGAEPARLPPGAAPPVFNLIATLAAAQGVGALRYTGPYPSETLFLGLLEAFRYAPEVDDPLGAFQRGELEWVPAPHEPLFVADDLYVQRRGRIEKVVWRGATYHRPDWQGIARHAPRRVRDAADGVRCGLWALGRPLADHLVLSPTGDLGSILEAPPPEDAVAPAPAEVWSGVVAAVVAGSAAPLAASIREVAAQLTLEWGPLDRELVSVEAGRVRADTRLRRVLAEALAIAPAVAAARAGLALAALAEIAAGAGDALRGRAQARLAAQPEAEQRAALDALGQPPAGEEEARAITAGVAALLGEYGTEGLEARTR